MKGNFGKIGILSLGLVLALGMLGAAFAYWSEPMTINSAVNTGHLQLKLTDIVPSNSNITCDQGDETGEAVSFTLTVSDAYPGYEGRVDFKIRNTGSIPAYIYDVEFDGSPGYPEWAHIDFNDLICSEHKYLGVGETHARFIKLTIDAPGPDVPENYTFTFTVTILSKQWNYAP